MKSGKFIPISIVIFSLALSACSPARSREAMMNTPTLANMEATATLETMMQNTATPGAMMNQTSTPGPMMVETSTPEMMANGNPSPGTMMDTPTPGNSMMGPAGSTLMEPPAWFGVSLTNIRDGATFKIDDFKGKVVLVEMMAVWCTNCKAQQEQIKMLRSSLGMNTDLVMVSLDIDPNENQGILNTYLSNNKFDWTYAVAPVGVSREIGQIYGDQFLNPTSTPMLFVDRTGVTHLLPFGIKSADDLQKAIGPYLNGK